MMLKVNWIHSSVGICILNEKDLFVCWQVIHGFVKSPAEAKSPPPSSITSQCYTKLLQGYTESFQGYTKLLQGYTKILQGYTKPLQGYTKLLQGYTKLLQGYTKPSQGYTRFFNQKRL